MRRQGLALFAIRRLAFVLVILATGVTAGTGLAGHVSISFGDLNRVSDALGLIRDRFVDSAKTEKETLIQGAIEGMIAKLDDPYSRLVPPRGFKNMQEEFTGAFGGVGMVLGEKDRRPTVISPIVDSPAFRAGIQAGDLLVSVDGKEIGRMSIDDVSKILRGPPGTTVKVGVVREGDKHPRVFVLTREEIKVPTIRAQMIDREIGYAYVPSFVQRTAEELDAVLSRFEARGMRSFILDLRQNPGGLLEAAVRMSRLFLSGSRIVTVKSRVGEEMSYSADRCAHGPFPLVVLVDGGSASASEIVAGAIKDNRRGVLLGNRTFGKGVVQTLYPMSDGSAISLTTAYYYTPGGTCIHKVGIQPDVAVEPKKLNESQIAELRAQRARFANDTAGGLDPSKNTFLTVSPHDVQLTRAVEILRSAQVFHQKLLGPALAQTPADRRAPGEIVR